MVEWTSPCPFTHIVVTAPNEKIASAFRLQLQYLQSAVGPLSAVTIVCAPDPPNCRVGSGGGTLNGISSLKHLHGIELNFLSKVLLIHSGGESRRLPTHSLCGKAWMSINMTVNEVIASPLVLLIKEASDLFISLPAPYVLVGCGDVILRLAHAGKPLQQQLGDGVYIVSVQAPVRLAQNHGVISADVFDCSAEYTVAAVSSYLQKPSVAAMEAAKAIIPAVSADIVQAALIDTGLVLFYGAAMEKLVNMALDSITFNCTTASMACSPTREPIRFELYSELLWACCTGEALSKEKYLCKCAQGLVMHSDLVCALSRIYELLSATPLMVIYCRNGQFVHLGTNRELLHACIDNVAPGSSNIVHSVLDDPIGLPSVTIISSFIGEGVLHEKAHNGVVEFCSLAHCRLPNCSMLSHLDSRIASQMGDFPSEFLVQQVFLQALHPGPVRCVVLFITNRAVAGTVTRALVMLHLDDNPKSSLYDASSRVGGLPWAQIFEKYSCVAEDLWLEADEQRTLWNAKLFPLFSFTTKAEVVVVWDRRGGSHMVPFQSVCWAQAQAFAEIWKRSVRVSLQDVLDRGSAEHMMSWKLLFDAARLTVQAGWQWRWQWLELIHEEWVGLRETCGGSVNAVAVVTMLEIAARSFSTAGVSLINPMMRFIVSENQLAPSVLNALHPHVSKSLDRIFQATGSAVGGALTRFVLRWLDANDVVSILHVLLSSYIAAMIPLRSHPRLVLWASILCETLVPPRTCAQVRASPEASYALDDVSDKELCNKLWSRSRGVLENCREVLCGDGEGREYACARLQSLAQSAILAIIELGNDNTANASVLSGLEERLHGIPGRFSLACAPVRIDLGGGWSDTPPICFDFGGAVLNVAVKVDGHKPIRCAVKCLPKYLIRIVCFRIKLSREVEAFATEEYFHHGDFAKLSHDHSPCALAKACLVALRVVSPGSSAPLAEDLEERLGCGLEIGTCSFLPAGSGMGGSSILAATVLRAVAEALSVRLSNDLLVSLVSQVEQLLLTGGGWQDQIGGSYGGFKIARSAPSLPLRVEVEPVACSDSFASLFNERTFLVYTGQQRLAKNTLINALKKYSVIGSDCTSSIVEELVQNAELGYRHLSTSSLTDEERYNELGRVFTTYWELKMDMAPGSNPPLTARILSALRGYCVGMSLCGAGAGGFAALLCGAGVEMQQICHAVAELNSALVDEADDEAEVPFLSVHSTAIDDEGLTCFVEVCAPGAPAELVELLCPHR